MDDFAPKPDIDSSAPASADDSSTSQTATLTADQAVAFGLENCKPGDTYTVKLRFTSDDPDGGKSVDVVSSEPDDMDDSSGQPPVDAEPMPPVGPDEGALEDDGTPDAAGDDQSNAEEKMLGFKRKKKKTSGVPFSIDKLRS